MRKVLKIILFIVAAVLLLLIGAVVYVDSPWGQSFVRGKAEAFLRKKLKTTVHIGYLGYGLPKYIVLRDVLFLDEKSDTLLSAGELKIDVAMMKLIHKKVDVQQLVFKGVHAHVYRNLPDTAYNFTYIINAFASNKSKPATKDTSSPSLSINLDRVRLDDIHTHFDDYTGGMHFALDLDHLDLDMKKLDLDQMLFHIKDLDIAGLRTSFSQDSSYLPPKPKDTAKTKFRLIADNMTLKNIGFEFNDALNKLLFGMQLADMQLQLNEFGLDDNNIDVKKLVMNNATITLAMGATSTAPAFVDTLIKKDTTTGWHITAGDVSITGANFKMDNNSAKRQTSGMDYSHLYFRNTALSINKFLYTSDTIAGSVTHFAGSEQCGLIVEELRTAFNYNPQGAILQNLYLKTPNTVLQNHVEVHYPSLAALQKRTQVLQLNLDIKNSTVGMSDVLLFVPQLKSQELFSKHANERFKIDAKVGGFLNNLNISSFSASGLSNTLVVLDGRLSGLPEVKDLSYNLHVSRFVTSRKDVAAFVPDSTLSQIRLPDRFGVTGLIAGTAADYNADVVLVSTDGRAYIKGTLATSPGKGKETYNMYLRTDQLNLGRILKQDSLMSTVSANILVKGKSFDPKTMASSVDAEILGAALKGYNYHDIVLHGKVAAQKGQFNFVSADSNLRVKITAQSDFSNKYPSLVADIKMDSMDFHALKLYGSELRTGGIIHADFKELNPDYPKGEIVWRQPVLHRQHVCSIPAQC